jgi:menaquinone-dependent protoporphyrinogen IX oxidase
MKASPNQEGEPLMKALRFLPLSIVLLWCAPVLGQEVVSGPDKGKKVPGLKVYDATGPNKEKEVDYAAERKDKLTVYLAIQADKWDRPMARFVKELDKVLQKEKDAMLVAVWLTEDVDKTKSYLPRAQQSLQLEGAALTVFTGDKEGPKGWNINSEAHITVVAAEKGNVTVAQGYRSINETEIRPLLKAIREAQKKE